jgi:hypothetical protein
VPEALPELTLPRNLPCWLAAGHSVEPQAVYADTAMRTGEARRRRVCRSAPRVVTVGMFLKAGQSPVFWDWYENRLRAGVEPFATRVPNQGPGLLWWRAQFVESPEYTMLARGACRVQAKLLLTGSGSTEGPVDSAVSSLSTVAAYGSAVVTVGKPMASVSTVALMLAPRAGSVTETAVTGDSSSVSPSTSAAITESAITNTAATASGGDTATAVESAATADSSSASFAASYAVLSVAFEGSNGSTAITDAYGHAVTVHGGVVISTAQFADGASSGRFPGAAGDRLSLAVSPDWDFGAVDFSIVLMIRPDAVSGTKMLLSCIDGLTYESGWYLYLNGAALEFVHYDNAVANVGISGGTLASNTWAKVESRRVGDVFTILVNDVPVATQTGAITLLSGGNALIVGYDPRNSGRDFAGYIDALKVFKGGIV